MSQHPINLDGDIVINLEDADLSSNEIVEMIIANPGALRQLAIMVRNTQTLQARRMGNLYGKTAQIPKPTPPTKVRLT